MNAENIIKSVFILCFSIQINEAFAGWREKTFRCVNGKHISNRQFCDGYNDCKDGSDESYGCDEERCGEVLFACESDFQCLNITVRCNGTKECEDGSDELYCDHGPAIEDCTIDKGKYLCKDKLRCLDLAYVCDGETNCLDGSDETSDCFKYDEDLCDMCIHPCFRTPDGPRCFCNTEDEKFDALCNEMKTCNFESNCEQKCVKYKQVEQCSCVNDYSLNDGTDCISAVPHERLILYCGFGDIKVYNISRNESYRVLQLIKLEELSSCSAIAGARNDVYWAQHSDAMEYAIFKTSLENYNYVEKIISIDETVFGPILSIAVDWITGNIYFTFFKVFVVCLYDGRRCSHLKSWGFSERHVAVAPKSGLMFLTLDYDDVGKNHASCVRRYAMDGSDEFVLVDKNIMSVYSLMVDENAETIYWLDYFMGKIESVQFDGNNRKIVFWKPMENLYSFSYYDGVLYWLRKQQKTFNEIFYRSKNGRIAVAILACKLVSNPCENSSCTGLCLLRPTVTKRLNYSCICSNFFKNFTSEEHDRRCYDPLLPNTEQRNEEPFLYREEQIDQSSFKSTVYPAMQQFGNQPILLYVVLVIVAILGSLGMYFGWRKWKRNEIGDAKRNLTQEEL